MYLCPRSYLGLNHPGLKSGNEMYSCATFTGMPLHNTSLKWRICTYVADRKYKKIFSVYPYAKFQTPYVRLFCMLVKKKYFVSIYQFHNCQDVCPLLLMRPRYWQWYRPRPMSRQPYRETDTTYLKMGTEPSRTRDRQTGLLQCNCTYSALQIKIIWESNRGLPRCHNST